MKLSVAVVDDLKSDRDRLAADLQALLRKTPEHELVCRVYESAEAFLKERPPVQMVFLDICMDGMNGIELARSLRGIDENLLIVFLSTSSEFAFDAFPIHPFDYLIKPYSQDKLEHVITEATRVLRLEDPKVTVRVARSVHTIPIGRVISVVARGHRVEVVIDGAETLSCTMTFTDLEKQLKQYPRFLAVNRGVLVNMDYARTLSGDSLLMLDGSSFPLRTKNRSEIISLFTHYQINRLRGGLP